MFASVSCKIITTITFMLQKAKQKNWLMLVDNIVMSKLTDMKNNSTYLTKYLDDVTRPLVLILPKNRNSRRRSR